MKLETQMDLPETIGVGPCGRSDPPPCPKASEATSPRIHQPLRISEMYPCPIDITDWPIALRSLIQWDSPPDFGSSRRASVKTTELEPTALLPSDALEHPEAQGLCWSAILLWLDDLHGSHEISQGISSREGSYWHGIMHRREPDYSNAKYWFRKVPTHPIHEKLSTWVSKHVNCREVRSKNMTTPWSSEQFVDLCADNFDCKTEIRDAIEAVAAAEWFFLFDYCRRVRN